MSAPTFTFVRRATVPAPPIETTQTASSAASAARSGAPKPAPYVLPFGKHAGKPIGDVPVGYAVWLAGFDIYEESGEVIECSEAKLRTQYKDTEHLKSILTMRPTAPNGRPWNHARVFVYTQHPEAFEAARARLVDKCYACGASLRAFRVTPDWDSRQLHKKCWAAMRARW